MRIVPLARRIIKEEQIDVVLTTVAPWSALLGGRLIQQVTGRPWVADFRDPWTDDAFNYSPTPMQRRIDERLERHLIERADAVISVTAPFVAALQQKASVTASHEALCINPQWLGSR